MNRWKIAFFTHLTLSLAVIGFLLNVVVDQGVTITYGRVGRADDVAHRDILNSLLISRISREQVQASGAKAVHDEGDYSYDVGIKDVAFQYDSKGKYRASSLGGSKTKGYAEKAD